MDTQFNKPTSQNSIEVLKVVKPTNKKRYCKTLGKKLPIASSFSMSQMHGPCFQQKLKCLIFTMTNNFTEVSAYLIPGLVLRSNQQMYQVPQMINQTQKYVQLKIVTQDFYFRIILWFLLVQLKRLEIQASLNLLPNVNLDI